MNTSRDREFQARKTAACGVKGCGRPRVSMKNRYCRAHWARVKANIAAGKRKPEAGIDATPLPKVGRPRSRPKTCTIRGCGRPHAAHGLCNSCYIAARRRGEL